MNTIANRMSRAEAIEIVRTNLTADQLEDLGYRIAARQESIDQEIADYGSAEDPTPLDELDAMVEALQGAEDVAGSDMEDAASRKAARADAKAYDRVLVLLGFYRPISDEKAREMCRNGINVRMSHFPVIDGQRYQGRMSFCEFLGSFDN